MISVAVGTVLRGDLIAAGCVRLDGRFDGRIICSRLEIGSDGYVNGSIAARELVVAGQIVGQVAAVAVALEDGAFVEGDIQYASMALDSGATMTGRAIRGPANYVPAELSLLENDIRTADEQLDQLEDHARQEMAKRAAAAYPAYQKARATLVASR